MSINSIYSFREASQKGRTTLVGELVGFMIESRNWWLLPIFLVLGLVAGLIFLSGTAAAPFIYTIF